MTVKEMIENLKLLNPDLTIYIADADTDWLLPSVTLVDEGNWVEISAPYEGRIKSRSDLE